MLEFREILNEPVLTESAKCVSTLKVVHEFYNSIGGKKPDNVKIIVSSLNYQNTPSVEEIGTLAARIQASGADIVKIVTTALDIIDTARIFVHSQVSPFRNNRF